jgi:ABC-type nitrate/sulfonate/bicarbonate transport system permease component
LKIDTSKARRFGISALGIALFFSFWHLLSISGLVDPIMLPSPLEVFRSSVVLAKTGELQAHIQASLLRMALGYSIGSACGITAGVLLGRSKFLEALVGPLLQMARAIPPLALVPLIIFGSASTKVRKSR